MKTMYEDKYSIHNKVHIDWMKGSLIFFRRTLCLRTIDLISFVAKGQMGVIWGKIKRECCSNAVDVDSEVFDDNQLPPKLGDLTNLGFLNDYIIREWFKEIPGQRYKKQRNAQSWSSPAKNYTYWGWQTAPVHSILSLINTSLHSPRFAGLVSDIYIKNDFLIYNSHQGSSRLFLATMKDHTPRWVLG